MNTYRQIFYQLVIVTKYRRPSICKSFDAELYKYLHGIIVNKKCMAYIINGIEDHVHIMCDLHPSVALSDFIKDIKVASSIWMKVNGKFPAFAGWQPGYGAFTYSVREKEMIYNYIKEQKTHHQKENFQDELKRILMENQVLFEEKFLM